MDRLIDGMWTVLSWLLAWVVPKNRALLVIGGRQFGGNTGPLLTACQAQGFRGVWLTRRSDCLAAAHDAIVSSRSLKGVWLGARAGAVCLTHSLGDFSPVVFPSNRTRLFNLWHGMPIKRISTQDPGFHQRKHARSNIREIQRYTAMFATSPTMAALFANTFMMESERVHVTGQPRTDVLFHGGDFPLEDRYDEALPKHRVKILYCPTWREGQAVHLFPFEDADMASLQSFLEALDAVLFVRTHPNDPGGLSHRNRRLVPMQGDIVPEITEALRRFDVLVTDYSSVYYDILMLDTPTIFLPYDLEQYARSPGFYLSFDEVAAGPRPTTQAEFLECLRRAIEQPNEHADARSKVRNRVHDYVDGHSTQRVLDVIKTIVQP